MGDDTQGTMTVDEAVEHARNIATDVDFDRNAERGEPAPFENVDRAALRTLAAEVERYRRLFGGFQLECCEDWTCAESHARKAAEVVHELRAEVERLRAENDRLRSHALRARLQRFEEREPLVRDLLSMADANAQSDRNDSSHRHGLKYALEAVRDFPLDPAAVSAPAEVCGKKCDHGSECVRRPHGDERHETQHGCVFFDAQPAAVSDAEAKPVNAVQTLLDYIDDHYEPSIDPGCGDLVRLANAVRAESDAKPVNAGDDTPAMLQLFRLRESKVQRLAKRVLNCHDELVEEGMEQLIADADAVRAVGPLTASDHVECTDSLCIWCEQDGSPREQRLTAESSEKPVSAGDELLERYKKLRGWMQNIASKHCWNPTETAAWALRECPEWVPVPNADAREQRLSVVGFEPVPRGAGAMQDVLYPAPAQPDAPKAFV